MALGLCYTEEVVHANWDLLLIEYRGPRNDLSGLVDNLRLGPAPSDGLNVLHPLLSLSPQHRMLATQPPTRYE